MVVFAVSDLIEALSFGIGCGGIRTWGGASVADHATCPLSLLAVSNFARSDSVVLLALLSGPIERKIIQPAVSSLVSTLFAFVGGVYALAAKRGRVDALHAVSRESLAVADHTLRTFEGFSCGG